MQKTRILVKRIAVLALLTPLIFSFASKAYAEEPKEYDANYHTMHHILDGYSWDLFKKSDGEYFALHFPRILWDTKRGSLDFFANTKNAVNKGGYIEIYAALSKTAYEGELMPGKLLVPSAATTLNRIKEQHPDPQTAEEIAEFNEKINDYVLSNYRPFDFSITRNVFFMLIATFILFAVFLTVARRYKNNPVGVPSGIQSFMEPVIIFVRDDIAKANIPDGKHERFLPLLLSFFFFIWILNIMGLLPMAANVSGNISFTASLALITLFVTNMSGSKDYWKHIFWFPGVPVPLKFLMMIIEIISVFVKPIALTIRLFAVITAGHVIIVSLFGLIFVIGNMGQNPLAGYGVSLMSVAFALFINLIELFVGTLQAYIFTLLSAVFIGQAVESHSHHEAAENVSH